MKPATKQVLVAVGFCSGALIQGSSICQSLPWLSVLGFILIALCVVFSVKRPWKLFCLCVALGFCYFQWQEMRLAEPLPASWHGNKGTMQGQVCGFPYQDRSGAWRFQLSNVIFKDAEGDLRTFPGSVQIFLSAQPNLVPVPGSRFNLEGKFATQPSRMNFGDPDWQKIQHRRGIVGRFYAEVGWELQQEPTSGQPLRVIWLLRRGLYQGLYTSREPGAERLDQDSASFLLGLTLGVGDDLPEEWEEEFQAAGLLHLLAVSGGNVAFFLWGVRFMLRKLPLSRRGELLLLMLAVIFFIGLTGLEPSVIRAGTMAILALLSRLWLRKTHWPSLLAITVLIIIIFQPFMLYEAGFRLSFLAVWGLFVWANPLSLYFQQRWHWPAWLALAVGATLAAQWAILPIGLHLFHQVSLVAPVSNLIFVGLIVPASPLLLLLGLAMPFGAATSWFFRAGLWYIQLLLRVGGFFAKLPFSAIQLPMPPLWLVCLAYAIQITLHYWPWPQAVSFQRKLGFGFLLLILLAWWHPWPYSLEVVVLDVGQGDCIFVRFPNGKTMLIDGGGSMDGSSQVGKKTVVPFLQRQGIYKLDLMILSHAHEDHYQGLIQVQESIPVQLILHGLPDARQIPQDLAAWLLAQPNTGLKLLQGGESIHLDPRVSIQVVQARFCGDGANNDSLVLHVQYGETEVWLTGDMEQEAEEALLKNSITSTTETLLKVAHHGGATSSGKAFLAAVQPELSVISAGKNNRYGHPAPITLERLRAVGSEIYLTADQGAVAFRSDGFHLRTKVCRP